MSVPYIRKEVLSLIPYQIPVDEEAIKLDQNESPWDIPAEAKVKIAERFLNTPLNRYPDAQPGMLKKQLAHFLGVWPDHLVIANGSNVLIQALTLAFAVGRKVVTLFPTFPAYAAQGQLLSNQVVEVPLNPDFTLNLPRVLSALEEEEPSLVFIANPNAPTGKLFKKDDLIEIIMQAPCPVVIDEAYYPFSRFTLVDQVKRLPKLIVLRTMSKAFAMAGVRLGYLVANIDIAVQISKVLLPFCVSSLSQVAAEVILEDPRWVQGYVDTIVLERKRLYGEMVRLRTLDVFPSDANFILFRVPGVAGAHQDLYRRLLNRKVLVRDVSDNGYLANCLRVTVGSPEENNRFLQELKKIVR